MIDPDRLHKFMRFALVANEAPSTAVGGFIYVDSMMVESVNEAAGGSLIGMVSGIAWHVKEPVDTVVRMVDDMK